MATRVSSRGRWPAVAVAARAAGVILAGIVVGVASAASLGEPWDDYTDIGALRLQLGQTEYYTTAPALPTNHDPLPPRFVYETKGKLQSTGGPRVDFVQGPEQKFILSGKCGGTLDTSGMQLVKLTAAGPYGDVLGFGPDSIGVYDGPKGVGCYRISATARESIRFDLGKDVKAMGARSFYRLELDMEVKQNARFELDVLRGGAKVSTFVMETGSSISAGSSTAPGAAVWACTAKSDSGPDAGALDNCRWVVNALGDGFVLRATTGEGSLEGGGDFSAQPYANNTVIYLTDVEVGTLGCAHPPGTPADDSPYTSTIGDGMENAQCSVTRVDPNLVTNGTYTCTQDVAYLFRTLPGADEGCELRKDQGEQVAAVLDIVFPPEPRRELNDVPPTIISFPDPSNGTWVDYPMPRCSGTLDIDANDDGVRIGGRSPDPTIIEVLTDPYGVMEYDQVSSTPSIEWGCVLDDEVDYTFKSATGGERMRVRQRILFWGDPIWTRPEG